MAIPENPFVEWRGDTARLRDIQVARYVMLYPTGAIVKGDTVSIDFTVSTVARCKHCKQATANDPAAVGIACQAASGASTTVPILVQVGGVYSSDGINEDLTANVTTAVAAGAAVMISASTAGRLDTYVIGTTAGKYVVGHATTLAASNQGGVRLANPFNL